jgi:nickel/cobalt transporter (NicO) family protein
MHAFLSFNAQKNLQRLVVMALALIIMGLIVYFFSVLLDQSSIAQPPARHPFGTGINEAPSNPQSILGFISEWQSLFANQITATLKDVTHNPQAAFWLLTLSFIYGVIHAAGPGHGKAVIAAYILASERALQRGLTMAVAAALLQALVAIGLVTILAVIFRVTSTSMTLMANHIEQLSFAAVALVGLSLLWKKSGQFLILIFPSRLHSGHNGSHAHNHSHSQAHSETGECCHHHAPITDDRASIRDMGLAVMAAGIRPCSGAILVLVFALSQKMFPLGIAAALVMAAGTALTTGSLAILAVLAKNTAMKLGGDIDNPRNALILAIAEMLAAALVSMLGIGLLISAH